MVTLWYRSPELLLGTDAYDGGVDVFSIALCAVEMLIGQPLLQGTNEIHQLDLITKVIGGPESDLDATSRKVYEIISPKKISDGAEGEGEEADEEADEEAVDQVEAFWSGLKKNV